MLYTSSLDHLAFPHGSPRRGVCAGLADGARAAKRQEGRQLFRSKNPVRPGHRARANPRPPAVAWHGMHVMCHVPGTRHTSNPPRRLNTKTSVRYA